MIKSDKQDGEDVGICEIEIPILFESKIPLSFAFCKLCNPSYLSGLYL